MEMEKINDDTIRVTLENEDLVKRHVTVLDLIGNHAEIEKFFYSILEEVDTDNQFADTDAVTFQMIPGKDGGLELLISKATQSRNDAAPSLGDEQGSPSDETLSDANNDYEHMDMKRLTELLSQEKERRQADDQMVSQTATYVYSNLQDLVTAIKLLPEGELPAKLYLVGDKYYLCVSTASGHGLNEAMTDALAVLAEYGLKSSLSAWSVAERGQLILGDHVFSQLKRYF